MLGGDELAGSASAKLVRVADGEVSVVDGPYAETREQLGGYFLVECDLDTALDYAARIQAWRTARSRCARSRKAPDPPERGGDRALRAVDLRGRGCGRRWPRWDEGHVRRVPGVRGLARRSVASSEGARRSGPPTRPRRFGCATARPSPSTALRSETEEQLGGFYLLECDHLDDALTAARACPGAGTARSRSARSSTSASSRRARRHGRHPRGRRPPVPAGVGARGRGLDPRARRLRPGRGVGAGGVRDRARAVAPRRHPGQPGRAGSRPRPATGRSTGSAGTASARRRPRTPPDCRSSER